MSKHKCLIIGDPVGHSLSPLLHNASYKALKIDDEFIFSAKKVKAENIGSFLNQIRGSDIKGLSCTIPHKELVLPYLDHIDETSLKIGAINTVVNKDGELFGFNTDWLGAIEPLQEICVLRGKNVAVLGAGGAARAFVYGLKKAGANVVIYNRTLEKAKTLAIQFACEFRPLHEQSKISQADIICNTTSVGLNEPNVSPLNKDVLNSSQIVFDAVYSPYKTKLLSDAEEAGANIIYGTEMLLYQAFEQFKLFTGLEAPKEVMRKVLSEHLNDK